MNMQQPNPQNGPSSPISLQGIGDTIGQTVNRTVEGLKNMVGNTQYNGINVDGQAAPAAVQSSILPNFNQFSSSSMLQGSGDFLTSNSIIAKLAFLIVVIILFVFLFQVGSNALAWIFKPSPSVHLFDGMYDGTKSVIFKQDPKDQNAKIILRSKNQNGGIEFTYSTWLYIDDIDSTKEEAVIFYKGESAFNCPKLVLMKGQNALKISMDVFQPTGTGVNHDSITVPNIPMKKWFHLVIRVENQHLDVYVNGTISKRNKLSGVPRQNYGNVVIASDGGFTGYISNLWYFNSGLSPTEIASLTTKGPNMKELSSGPESKKPTTTKYLAFDWYLGRS